MAGELDPIARQMLFNGLQALERIGDDLLGRAQRDAPLDEGTLRGSGSSELVIGEDGNTYVEVSFNTPYAARQHEEITWSHTDGKAKYLEDPLKEMAGRYEGILGAAIGRGF